MSTFVEQLVHQYGDRFQRPATAATPLAVKAAASASAGRALAAAAADSGSGAPAAAAPPAEESWNDAWDGPDDGETRYAVRFLTFVYQVPFRLVAVQQELMDVFGYRGKATKEFLDRFKHMDEAQRTAFRSLLLEHQRLSLLRKKFQAAERSLGENGAFLDNDERASVYATALDEATREWSLLLADRESASRRLTGRATSDLLGGPADGPQLTLPFLIDAAPPAGRTEMDFVRDLISSPLRGGRKAIVEGAYAFSLTREERAALPQNDPDLGEQVLDALAEREIREAERRFQRRVRWVIGLTKQQRTVVAYRALGKKRRDTAETLGISEESVKTHLQRADAEWERLSADPTAAASTEPRTRGAGRGRLPAGSRNSGSLK